MAEHDGHVAGLLTAVEVLGETIRRGGGDEMKRYVLTGAIPPSELGTTSGPPSLEERIGQLEDQIHRIVEYLCEQASPGTQVGLSARLLLGR